MKLANRPIVTRKRVPRQLMLACRGLILFAGSCLLAPTQAAGDAVYKWVNEHNEVQYTQMPPPYGITAIRIKSAPPLHAEGYADKLPPAEAAGNTAGDGVSDTGQGEAGDTSSRDAETARSMKENCINSRNNLASLNRGNIRFMGPDGEVFRLDEEERQQRIKEANEQIKLLCKS